MQPKSPFLAVIQVGFSSEVWRIMCHPSRLFSRVSRCRAALISLLTSTRGQLCELCFPDSSLSLLLPFSPSLSLFLHKLQRVPIPVSHFFSSRGEPSRLIFFPVAHPTNTVVYNSQTRPGREISAYLCTYVRNERAGDTSLKRRVDDFPSVRLCSGIKTTCTASLGTFHRVFAPWMMKLQGREFCVLLKRRRVLSKDAKLSRKNAMVITSTSIWRTCFLIEKEKVKSWWTTCLQCCMLRNFREICGIL